MSVFRKYGRALERAALPADPNAVVGCYTLHLTCTHPRHQDDRRANVFIPLKSLADGPGEFLSETKAEALSAARQQGWYISRDEQRVLCPYHAKQVAR